ncbi:MAG: chemotaxis protein CheW [Rhodospirillaceae bacterium]|nr:chemotaxis protein CheW [Rhodospirillaceae bacterium]
MLADSDARTGTDWQTVHERIQRLRERLDASGAPTPEQIDEVLSQRAAVLAQPKVEQVVVAKKTAVRFRCGRQSCALPSGQMMEAIELQRPTVLPGLPHIYLGVVYHRGRIYPVIDPVPVLGLEPTGDPPEHAILIALEEGTAALAVAAIEGLMSYAAADLEPVDITEARHMAMQGMLPDSVLLLDAGRLLSDVRLVVNELPVPAIASDGGNL